MTSTTLKTAASLLPIMAALAACVNSSETYMPDGRKGYTVSCNGAAFSWNHCLSEAGELCGERGYDTYDRTEHGVMRNMVIACKP